MMPWDSKPLGIALGVVLWNVVYISCARRDCSNINVSVPKPNLKYYLNGKLYVSWANDRSGIWNYTVNYCCTVPRTLSADCKHECPSYGKMEDCDFKDDTNLCNIYSTQFVEYNVYLSTEIQGCPLRSEEEELTPRVKNAHPDQVPVVNMVIENNKLVVQWSKSSEIDESNGACYYVTCHEMEGTNKGKQVLHEPKHKTLTISVGYELSHYSSYQCCVKVHFCRDLEARGPFSEPVCNQSMTPAAAPSEPPKMLCGDRRKCPTVVRNNSRDVTLLWQLPVNTTWNGILTKIAVHVQEANESDVIHSLNGTATEYTLKGLKMGVEYRVFLTLCTVAGCSSISTPVLLRAERKDHTTSFLSNTVLVITSIAATVTIIVLVACCIVDWRRNPIPRTDVPLPSLWPPIVDLPEGWSGESVTASIGANAEYHRLARGSHAPLDTISQGSSGACSVDSFESYSGVPLLSKNSRQPEQVQRPWITTTNFPEQPAGTVSSLKPRISDDEGSEFV